jgi:hypothetical protein
MANLPDSIFDSTDFNKKIGHIGLDAGRDNRKTIFTPDRGI